ncbi:MAG: dephospho-CoA kinase [Lachnospiraceae bacterium]|nr:dephospho-CoA kinase [Lachnospiraceae bacterium]
MPMKFIGITGGVGAGKSLIMDYLERKPRTAVLYSDRFAGELEKPGQACYDLIRKTFPDPALYNADGTMNRPAFAALVFRKPAALDALNSIVHPAVREAILFDVAEKRGSRQVDFYFLEAALLIEGGYDRICDELWVVTASLEARRKRLSESRGYSREKIDSILSRQESDEVFLSRADRVIHNDGTPEEAYAQADRFLAEMVP